MNATSDQQIQKNICVVDDNEDYLTIVEDVLSGSSYRVTCANSIKSLNALNLSEHGIYLLDISLGDGRGTDVINKIRDINKYAYCVMMTAYCEYDYAIRALNNGANAFLEKPIDTNDLLNAMRQAEDVVRLRIENEYVKTKIKEKNALLEIYNYKLKKLVEGFLKLNSEKTLDGALQAIADIGCDVFGTEKYTISEIDTSWGGAETQDVEPVYIEQNNTIDAQVCFGSQNKFGKCITFHDIEGCAGYSEAAIGRLYAASANENIKRINTRLELQNINARQKQIINELSGKNEQLMTYEYSVSNALKVPIRHAIEYANIFHEQAELFYDEGVMRYCRKTKNSIMKIKKIVEKLSVLSYVANKRIDIHSLDLASLLRIVVSMECSKKDVKIKLRCNVNELYADQELVSAMLKEVVINSIEHSGRNDIVLTVMHKIENNEVVYQISDNGVGIDEHRAQKIFLPFHAYHTDDVFGGTGLGMAIIDRAVTRHGGKVWVDSECKEGFRLKFTLSENINK